MIKRLRRKFILINLLVDILYAIINPRICFK